MQLHNYSGFLLNVLDSLPDDALIVDLGLGRDLSGDHDHPRLGHRLTCNLHVVIGNVKSNIRIL